jgi:uncharacterized protein (DUF924 family)
MVRGGHPRNGETMPDPHFSDAASSEIKALLDFWFEPEPADEAAMRERLRRWFSSSAAQDRALAERFGDLAGAAAAGRLDPLAATARGRLGLIILLDQLPRNLYRGTARAFAQDAKALALCLEGMESGQTDELAPLERVFHCMPLQHAESRTVQTRSVEVFAGLSALEAPAPVAAALATFADYAVAHRDIVARFGRFPHRNAALGRASTDAERAYLAEGGSSFGQ